MMLRKAILSRTLRILSGMLATRMVGLTSADEALA